MRADDRHSDTSRRTRPHIDRWPGDIRVRPVKAIRKRQQRFVRKRRTDKSNAKGEPVGTESPRRRHCCLIQQVDEVRVVTQIGVAPHRVRCNLLMHINRGRRRHHQHIHARPLAFRIPPESPQPVFRLKGIDRRILPRPPDNPAHHRIHIVGIRFEKRLDRGQSLRHPRPRIQQLRYRPENRKVDLDARAAHLLQPLHSSLIQARIFLIAKKLKLVRSRHSEAKFPASPRRRAFSRTRHTRIRVTCIAALRHPPHRLRIATARSKNRNTIQRPARRHHARRAQQAARRFQPDQIIESRRNAPRPRRVRTQRKAH